MSRVASLDVFRGIAVAAMLVANAPGPAERYILLEHMPWNGCSLADLIFPAFLFIVGAAIPLSNGSRLHKGQRRPKLALRALRRAALLVLAGLPMGIGLGPAGAFRIPGVLQRIGACYLPAALLGLWARGRTVAAVAGALLVGYWLLLTRVPVPGFGAGDLSPAGNLASYVDRLVLGAHMSSAVFDAEGLLSTLPAIATTLLGVLSGMWLHKEIPPRAKAASLGGAGVAAAALGLLWGRWFPLNKHLYTSSYALFASGFSAALLGLLYWRVDIAKRDWWTGPFKRLGVHALLAFFGTNVAEGLLDRWQVAHTSARLALRHRLFGGLKEGQASLAFAVFWLLLWYWTIKATEAARARAVVARAATDAPLPD